MNHGEIALKKNLTIEDVIQLEIALRRYYYELDYFADRAFEIVWKDSQIDHLKMDDGVEIPIY